MAMAAPMMFRSAPMTKTKKAIFQEMAMPGQSRMMAQPCPAQNAMPTPPDWNPEDQDQGTSSHLPQYLLPVTYIATLFTALQFLY